MELPRKDLNFGQALEWLNGGIPMRRAGWNAPHLILLQRPDEHSKMTKPYIYMNTVQGDNIPWVASQADLLANDWEVVGKEQCSNCSPRRPAPPLKIATEMTTPELNHKMLAKVRRGNHKGELVEIMQWCNDWFSTNLGIFSPANLLFTTEDFATIRQHDKNGVLFTLYKPVTEVTDFEVDYICTFRKYRRTKVRYE